MVLFISMDGFVKIARKDQLKISSGISIRVDGEEIALFQRGTEVYAVRNECPHQHFQLLHQGEIDGSAITCPMHGWKFDFTTGNGILGGGNLKPYTVKLVGDDVWLKRPQE